MVFLNLVFSIVIVILSYWEYTKVKNATILFIGAGFGLFGISHFSILMGVDSSQILLILIRSLGYIMVIIALIRSLYKSKSL